MQLLMGLCRPVFTTATVVQLLFAAGLELAMSPKANLNRILLLVSLLPEI